MLLTVTSHCPEGPVAGRDAPGCESPKFLSPVGPAGPGAGAGHPQALRLAAEKTAAKRHRQSRWKSPVIAAVALQGGKKHTQCNFFPLSLSPSPTFSSSLLLRFLPSPACCRTMCWREPCTQAASWIRVRSGTETSCPGWWSRTSSYWGRRTSGCRHKCRTSTRTSFSPKKRCKTFWKLSVILSLALSIPVADIF